jgi:hypothetical protein
VETAYLAWFCLNIRYVEMVFRNEDDHEMTKVHPCHGCWYKLPFLATVVQIKINKYAYSKIITVFFVIVVDRKLDMVSCCLKLK